MNPFATRLPFPSYFGQYFLLLNVIICVIYHGLYINENCLYKTDIVFSRIEVYRITQFREPTLVWETRASCEKLVNFSAVTQEITRVECTFRPQFPKLHLFVILAFQNGL